MPHYGASPNPKSEAGIDRDSQYQEQKVRHDPVVKAMKSCSYCSDSWDADRPEKNGVPLNSAVFVKESVNFAEFHGFHEATDIFELDFQKIGSLYPQSAFEISSSFFSTFRYFYGNWSSTLWQFLVSFTVNSRTIFTVTKPGSMIFGGSSYPSRRKRRAFGTAERSVCKVWHTTRQEEEQRSETPT